MVRPVGAFIGAIFQTAHGPIPLPFTLPPPLAALVSKSGVISTHQPDPQSKRSDCPSLRSLHLDKALDKSAPAPSARAGPTRPGVQLADRDGHHAPVGPRPMSCPRRYTN